MGMGYWYKCEKCKQAYVFIYRNAYLLRPQTDDEVNAQIAASTNEDLKEFVILISHQAIEIA